ncbi:hypothetical protein [Klebsiella variicola]|uniref:hypothetical protein n=1 Tax=Klebsiella variicola TaxID=244366 RepID=UPI001FA6F914|nr:hypothetical protein [Klebsiella variicola]MCI4448733.1 hypothetical protein [Klebsiella variicola]
MIGIIMSICYFIDTSFAGYVLVSQNERLLIPLATTKPAKRGKDISKRSATNREGGEHPSSTAVHAPEVQSPSGYLQPAG